MKKVQENKLSMYYAVRKVCNDNNTVWIMLIAFGVAFSKFKSVIDSIEKALGIQSTNIKGVTEGKKNDEESMIDLALKVAGAVFAFASKNDKPDLKRKVDYSRSDLKKVRDSVTLQIVKVIRNEANGIIAALADFGITPADITALDTFISNNGDTLAAPRAAISTRKGATKNIVAFEEDADKVLKEEMDKLMENFKTTNPDFYKLYFDARIIVDSGVHHKTSETPTPPSP